MATFKEWEETRDAFLEILYDFMSPMEANSQAVKMTIIALGEKPKPPRPEYVINSIYVQAKLSDVEDAASWSVYISEDDIHSSSKFSSAKCEDLENAIRATRNWCVQRNTEEKAKRQ